MYVERQLPVSVVAEVHRLADEMDEMNAKSAGAKFIIKINLKPQEERTISITVFSVYCL